MPQDSDSSVFAAVRAAARPVTVAELQERGVAEVRSIRMAQVCEVLEQAIRATLMARAVQDKKDDTGVAAETRDRFVALMQGETQAGPDPLTESASRELRRLNADLAQQRSDLARDTEQLATGRAGAVDDDSVLERDLRRRFRRYTAAGMTIEQLEDAVVEDSLAALRRERIHVREAELAARQSDTRFLQRRIQKLKDLLTETEQRLPGVDRSLAAGHRADRGLDPEDSQDRAKINLLDGIFDQNRREQSRHRRRGGEELHRDGPARQRVVGA